MVRCGAVRVRVRCLALVQLDLSDASGRTAVHVASQAGQLNALREILGRSVDVNATDAGGDSALHLAALSGKVCDWEGAI